MGNSSNPVTSKVPGGTLTCEAFPRRGGRYEVICSLVKGDDVTFASHGTWPDKSTALSVAKDVKKLMSGKWNPSEYKEVNVVSKVVQVYNPEIAWEEFDKKGQLKSKRKEFNTEKAMQKFIEKLKEEGNLYQILGYRDNPFPKVDVKYIKFTKAGRKWFVRGIDKYGLPVKKRSYVNESQAIKYAYQLKDEYNTYILWPEGFITMNSSEYRRNINMKNPGAKWHTEKAIAFDSTPKSSSAYDLSIRLADEHYASAFRSKQMGLKNPREPSWEAWYGAKVKIKPGRGMDEFANKIGTVTGIEGEYLRIKFDPPVYVKGVGMVKDDLWMPYLVRKVRSKYNPGTKLTNPKRRRNPPRVETAGNLMGIVSLLALPVLIGIIIWRQSKQ